MIASRLPYAPLERQLRLMWGAPAPEPGDDPRWLWTDARAGELLGVTRWQIRNYRRDGLSPRQADRAAIAAGLHPLLVWRKAWTCAEIGTDLRRKEKAA